MKESKFNLFGELTAVAAVLALQMQANVDLRLPAVSALAFACLFLFDHLLTLLDKMPSLRILCELAAIGACFVFGVETYLPVLLMLLYAILSRYAEGALFWQISAALTILLTILFPPPKQNLTLLAVLILLYCVVHVLLTRLAHALATCEEQRALVAEQKKKLGDMKSYIKTIREATALEERNRFAARIHDQLGHGISGSILLLEGAKLNLRTHPDVAQSGIETAVENLRRGVDEIRMSLREERPDRHALGLSALQTALEQFRLSYDIRTQLETNGDLTRIPPPVWICIGENLTEALTNTLKHSNATVFTLRLSVYQKFIRVEYRDNGASEGAFVKGLGTEAIEERTAVCGGKCLFQKGCGGFCVTNLFML